MNVDDFVKILLSVALAFTMIGVTIQIIRIIGGFIATIKIANKVLANVDRIVEKFTDDYDYLVEQIKMIVDSVSNLSSSVFNPLAKFTLIFNSIEGIFSRKKNKSKKEVEKDNFEKE